MTRVLTALALTAGLALAGCGGDDDDEADTGTGTPPAAETAPAEEPPAAAGTIEVTADPDGQLAYVEDELSATAGTVTIAFDNPSQVPHDVRIEDDSGEDIGGTEVITGEEATAEVELTAGSYAYYCSVSGHRDAGMEGTLLVE